MSYAQRSFLAFVLLAASALPAGATFHFMQIEQAVGGLCGDVAQQAIQLRMRANGQNQVATGQLIAYDAAGANPVVLVTFPSNVAISTLGSRILAASSAFATGQGVTPDFTMSAAIPESYLPAGRLTFEEHGDIVWSLSWGGDAYTGSTAGSTDNDADGVYGPSWPGALPSQTDMALLFQGGAAAMSTSNAANYALSPGEAIFTRNNGSAFMVVDCFLFADGFESADTAGWSITTP